MYRNNRLLKTKTETLNTALFYNFSSNLLRFPTSLIQLLTIDERATISFKITKPFTDISDMDKMFPAELFFYKKDCAFYTRLHGIAAIDEEINQSVIIKFKTLNAECFYRGTKAATMFEQIRNTVRYFFKLLYYDEPNYASISFA